MPATGKEVLIIEDMEDQRVLTRKILENSGVLVSEADSVDKALALLANKSPHLVLLDLQMPNKSGFDFLEQKNAYPALDHIPIIVTSGLQDKGSVHKAISLGASDYLVKPFTSTHLLQKIRKHLRDTNFLTYTFSASDQLNVKISSEVKISKMSATSFFLESMIKLGPQTQLQLQCTRLEQLGLSSCFFVTDPTPAVRSTSGLYSVKVNVVGLSKVIDPAVKKEPL